MDTNEKTVETVFDYLRWRGDLTFAQDAFSEVDNLILCIITYLNFRRFDTLRSRDPSDALALGEIVSRMTPEDEQQGLSPNDYIPLMQAAADSVRFGSVRMFGYETVRDEEREMQLDALSFLVPDGTLFCAFMGTDRSLVGWKENLNLSFMDAVPAQVGATEYVTDMAAHCPDRLLRIGGHSKGGNLAVYSGVFCPESIQKRIIAVWSNDGPGFHTDLLDLPEHQRIAERIYSIVPKSSVVGMLLEHEEDYAVVDSDQLGFLQHDGFSWQVLGDHFVTLRQMSRQAHLSDQELRKWVHGLSVEQRETFVSALFDVLTASGAVTLTDLKDDSFKAVGAMVKAMKDLDKETRDGLWEFLAILFKSNLRMVLEGIQEDTAKKRSGKRRLAIKKKEKEA